MNVIVAICAPVNWLQSTLNSTRSSGFVVETEPFDGEILSHEALAAAVKVKEFGPPAPTSM